MTKGKNDKKSKKNSTLHNDDQGISGRQVHVKVIARYRPCGSQQHIKHSHNLRIIHGKSNSFEVKEGKSHMFHLDMIFNDTATQQQMFQQVGEPIVRDVLHGYNGTIFAYGQTGSGKTHTLFGDMSTRDSKQRGIIPRSCEALFDHFQSAEGIEEVTIKCSFVEIYNEKLQDLLTMNSKGKRQRLKIRENLDKTIYVDGVHEEYVSSFDDVFELLQIGFRNRAVASTLMNHQSSRSHCVLTLNIKQTLKGGTIKISKINFADLAGCEKIKKTGATGVVLEQAKAINQSLSALGNVIYALTTKGKKHIPYRDSTLTFLLQDSLGGNTKTSLVVTCSSDSYNFEETLNTMRFATRAKRMTNKVKMNKQQSVKELQAMIAMYKKKLQKANEIILKLRSGKGSKGSHLSAGGNGSDSDRGSIDSVIEDKVEELQSIIERKDREMDQLREEVMDVNAEVFAHRQREQELKDELDICLSEKSKNDLEEELKKEVPRFDPEVKEVKELKEEQEKAQQTLNVLKSENEAIKQDRAELLKWNQSLKKQLAEFKGRHNPPTAVTPQVNRKIVKPVILQERKTRNHSILSQRSSIEVIHDPDQCALNMMLENLSDHLLQYFGQKAMLRGPLWICNLKDTTSNFKVKDSDFHKVYVVLAKREMIGYRSLFHAESDTKHPLFRHDLKRLALVETENEFVVESLNERFVLRVEGSVSRRDEWLDKLERAILDCQKQAKQNDE